jgi:hypothetical protein
LACWLEVFGLLVVVFAAIEEIAGSGLAGWCFGRWFSMAGSLTILYRRKRNVGGRVLRNFARGSSRYFGGHVSREDVTCV